eukprot:CAMPEP_0169090038 /NCGR_PEP_ID=MMETSP1015-20121227/15609_1 /TAXON_ID=342587 /ORGANISM="Karlodinium micrum, Strain CCMP2283" /LENGTH=316 /DNA_ID=CAMNT_0009150423 /DNA_START=86 /DNA_END=1035 /DNA_ORIENTATION=-
MAVVILVAVTMLMLFSLCVIGFSMQAAQSRNANIRSYEELTTATAGNRAGILLEVIIVFYMLGACTGFLTIVGDMIVPLIANENSFLMSWIGSAAIYVAASSSQWAFALTSRCPCCGDLNVEVHFSDISLCGVLYLVFILALDAGRGDEAVSQFKPVWPGVAISVPLMTFALNCHIQAPIVYAELKPKLRNAPKMGIACGLAMVICLLIYLPAGIFGYLRFGESVLGDVLTVGQGENNHCSASSVGSGGFLVSDYWADGARVCLAVTAMSGYALNHFPARPALFSIYKRVARLSGRSAVTADSPPFIFVMIEGVTW